jgi:hypothetical protein
VKKTEIVVGDTLDFETSITDYPNGDGWTLNYRLVPISGTGSAFEFTAGGSPVEDPLGYRVQLAPATTAAWVAGDYAWNSYVTKTGARYTVESGQVTLLPDPAQTAVPLDNRSHARKVLESIQAVIEGRATKDQQEYTIGDRSLKRMDPQALLHWRDYYKAEVAKEDNDERIANGGASRSKVLVRL